MNRTALALALALTAPFAHAQSDAGAPDGPARYDALLRAVVRGNGVDYAALRARRDELVAVHTWFATHGPTATPAEFASRSARLAYWINAYNVTVLRGIVEAPASMDNVLTYLPDGGFFRARRWRLDGRERTLDEVENREVRETFHDPRVHVALNCGARSCPPLRAGAYTAAAVDRQLDEQARRYVTAPNAAVVDAATHTVRVSQLFEWFRDDFRGPFRAGGVQLGGVVGFFVAHGATALRTACGDDAGACTLTFAPYDWSLNRAR